MSAEERAGVGGNYAAALKAEQKRCVRGYQACSSEDRARHSASYRLGHRQRERHGEAYWTHPDVPGVCFPTRLAAARAAMEAA